MAHYSSANLSRWIARTTERVHVRRIIDRRAVVSWLTIAWGWLAIGAVAAAGENWAAGRRIYEEKCASCHGGDGQGSKDGFADPLAGEHSLELLTRLIQRTMPQDDPGSCTGEEAQQVAEFVYHEFYSFPARLQKGLAQPPRVELLRLSVPQYRQVVADLLAQFTPPPEQVPRRRNRRQSEAQEANSQAAVEPAAAENESPQPGIKAEYFQSKGMSKADEHRLRRVDASIDFDFGEKGPAENIDGEQFAIIWEGSLQAPETGYYEFRLSTPNGARFYLNNDTTEMPGKLRDDSSVAGQSAQIDVWVSSGEMRTETARVFLLGDRDYPLRVEFFKYKEKLASVRLEWKPPHGVWRVLDRHHLTTARSPRTFVIDTPFPADDRSMGYERGRAISAEWHAAASQAAMATAAEVVNRLELLARAKSEVSEEERPAQEAKIHDFCRQLASAAFRRPLTQSELRELDDIFAASPKADVAVRRSVLWTLSSPNFLYVDLTPPGEKPTQHTVAARLAFALWDSLPDAELLQAADRGELTTAEQIRRQAHRMLDDPRAHAKVGRFFHHWLELDERDLTKDPAQFPQFTEATMADLRRSLELFVDRVFWSESSDYRELLLADYLLLNQPLRELYERTADGSDAAATAQPETSHTATSPPASSPAAATHVTGSASTSLPPGVTPAPPEPTGAAELAGDMSDEGEFVEVKLSEGERAGILTHPYLLSALAYHNNTSPIHRGVFLTRKIVGRGLRPPPIAVAFKDDEFAPDLTMREKTTQLTRDQACLGCHGVINPLGYTLEHFDAIGRWRWTDRNKPVDSKAVYVTVEGDELSVERARDVASFALTSESAHRSFVTHLFHHLSQQDAAAYSESPGSSQVIDRLRQDFVASNFHMQQLVIGIAEVVARHGTGGGVAEIPLVQE